MKRYLECRYQVRYQKHAENGFVRVFSVFFHFWPFVIIFSHFFHNFLPLSDHRELCIDDLINQNAQFQTKNQLNQRFSIAETLDNANYPVFNKNTILETSPMEIHPEIHSEIHQQIHPENTHHHSNQNSTSSAHKFDKMIAPRTATPITFENFTSSDQDNQDSDFVSVPTPRMQVCGTQSHQQPVFAKTPRIVRDAGIEINTDEDNLDDMSSGKWNFF